MIVSEFLFWGVVGIMTELCFTAVKGLIVDREVNLVGHTSLWMFPVYGFGLSYGFDFVMSLIKNDAIRYLTYPLWIWCVELLIGYPAVRKGIRIWDYRYLPNWLHWKGIVSFAHYPLWVCFGIMVELIK